MSQPTRNMTILIQEYDESADEFTVKIQVEGDVPNYMLSTMGSGAAAMLAGFFDEPSAFVGQYIEITAPFVK